MFNLRAKCFLAIGIAVAILGTNAGEVEPVTIRGYACELLRSTAKPQLGLDRFTVNVPGYLSPAEKSNLVALMNNEPNVDFISLAPLIAKRGEVSGLDWTDEHSWTNSPPPAVSETIIGDMPGMYWRFKPGATGHPLIIDFEFAVYETKEDSPKKRPLLYGSFKGPLQFHSNEVALVRLPPRRQFIEKHERQFFRTRKIPVVETNDLFLMIEVERAK